MEVMSTAYDLTYDPNEVGGDMVVECWISHGTPLPVTQTSIPSPGSGSRPATKGRNRPAGHEW